MENIKRLRANKNFKYYRVFMIQILNTNYPQILEVKLSLNFQINFKSHVK